MQKLRSRIAAGGLAAVAAVAAIPAGAQQRGSDPYYYLSIWQGWYAGVHLGYGEAGLADGFVGGGQVGYNWRYGQIVYGLEADISLSDISFSESVTVCNPGLGCVSADVNGSIDWMATVRGRLGYLISPTFLAYGTAGFGIASGSASASVSGFRLTDRFSVSNTETDLVFGIGLEGKFNPMTTARIEYLTFGDLSIDVIRVGLSFRFGN
jgi:opacity protein-like surface antigen